MSGAPAAGKDPARAGGGGGDAGDHALRRGLLAAAARVLGPDHGIGAPRVVRGDPGAVPATGPSFGVARRPGVLEVGIPDGPLLDAVLARESALLGFPEGARKRGFVQHACSWVAWRLARGAPARKAFWDAWAAPLLAASKGISLHAVPPVLLAEIDRVREAAPRAVLAMLRTAAADSQALAGRVTGMESLATWVPETVAAFTTDPTGDELATCMTAARLFVATGRVSAATAIQAAAWLPPDRFARALAVASCWLSFARVVNAGCLDTLTVLVACTSPKPPSAIDALLDVPGMTVRLAVTRGALAGGTPAEWHATLATLAVPAPALPAVLRHVEALTGAGLFSTVATWILDATTTCVNGNRHDPAIPAFTLGSAGDAATDDPALIVASTVDHRDGRRRAPAVLASLPRRRPAMAKFFKFLEAVQSPFTLVSARHGAERARLVAACGARPETVRRWLHEVVPAMTVPHPRVFHHVLPYNPSFSTVLAVTPATLSRAERARLAAPFVSWQASPFHHAVVGQDGIFWQFRVPAGAAAAVADHVHAIVPAARVGSTLVHELSHRHFSFLPWFDFAAGRHVDASAVVGGLTASALAVLAGTATVAEHHVLLRATERRRVLGHA